MIEIRYEPQAVIVHGRIPPEVARRVRAINCEVAERRPGLGSDILAGLVLMIVHGSDDLFRSQYPDGIAELSGNEEPRTRRGRGSTTIAATIEHVPPKFVPGPQSRESRVHTKKRRAGSGCPSLASPCSTAWSRWHIQTRVCRKGSVLPDRQPSATCEPKPLSAPLQSGRCRSQR